MSHIGEGAMPVREGQLVCQHLENVSRDALEHYSEIIRTFVRGRHGIYALYRKNCLYYVGLATNLRARINQHLRDRHAETWDHFSLYLTVGHQHLREIECLLVRIGRPRGNRAKPQFIRSENLGPGLRRQISECQRRELKELFPGTTPGNVKLQTGKKREAPPREGRRPTLAPYVTDGKGFPIRFSFKGRLHRARVRANGTIGYQGQVFASPSSAAQAVTKKASDGWKAWRYRRAPGDWVPLSELRE
jgi:hypothetical protein